MPTAKASSKSFAEFFGPKKVPGTPPDAESLRRKPDLYPEPENNSIAIAYSSGADGSSIQSFQGKDIAAAVNFFGGINEGYVDNDIQGGGGYNGGGTGIDTQRGSGSVQTLLLRAIPKRKSDRIAKAQLWSIEDDLLQRLIEVKMDFTTVGLSLQIQPPEDFQQTDDSVAKLLKIRKAVRKIKRIYELRKVVHDMLRDFYVTDSMILYWRLEENAPNPGGNEYGQPSVLATPIKNLLAVYALNPADVDWDNSLGVNIMKVKVPDALRSRIMQALLKSTKERVEAIDELLKSGVAQKWIDAVEGIKNGKHQSTEPIVTLDRNDGDNWIVCTKGRTHYGLANPSMYPIFLSLEQRRSLIEGDFSTAFMMKHFIMLIQQGESVTDGPMPGDRRNWLGKEDAEALVKLFTNVSKSMRLALNHTTKISFIYPPKEMFNTDKYITCEQRIFNWGGITSSVMTGDGGTYNGGFIGIKKLVANISNARELISDVLTSFFADPNISSAIGLDDEDYEVVAKFDENILKEPAQLLDEIEALVGFGYLDPRTALRELGRDPETVKSLKAIALKEADVWKPMEQSSKGGASKDKGGRPANHGTTKNEGTRTQSKSTVTS